MIKTHFLIYMICFSFILSCKNESKPQYENQAQLEDIIREKVGLDLKKQTKNSSIVILHESDCICTDENIQLTKDLINNAKYKNYQFIVIVKGKEHKFLKSIDKRTLDRVTLVKDTNEFLMKRGYISTTDRIITYNKGSILYFDMKFQKNEDIRNGLNFN